MKILKLRERNLDFDANGATSLKKVMAGRFKKNRYTHICIAGVVYCVSIISGIVWLESEYK